MGSGQRNPHQEALSQRQQYTYSSAMPCISLISEFSCLDPRYLQAASQLLETIRMHFMLLSQYYLKQCIWWNAGFTKTNLLPINCNKIRFLLAKEPLKQELSYQVIMQALPIPWETPGAVFCIKGAQRTKIKVLYLFKEQKITLSFIYTERQGSFLVNLIHPLLEPVSA